MRKLVFLSVSVCTVFLQSLVLEAQDELWTLEKCIEYSWNNNLQIQQQSLSVESNENLLKKSKLAYIPSFSANINENLNWGRSVDLKNLEIIKNSLSTSTNASLSASIMLFDGLSKIYSLQGSRLNLSISLQEVERLKNEKTIQITKAYLQVLLSKQLLQTSIENLESIQSQRDRTKILVEAGSQPYSALLEMEAQLSSERVQMVTCSSNLKTNILALTQLLDLENGTDFKVFIPQDEALDACIASYHSSAIDEVYADAQRLPRIRGAELSLEKSRIDLKSAKGKYYPTLSLSASYGAYYTSTSKDKSGHYIPFFDQIRDNVNPTVGFGLSIPIFNNYTVATNVKNAALEVKRQELELRSRHNDLYKEVQQAIVDADSFYEKMQAAEINLRSMTESFRYTEEKFNVGAVNSTDYIVSKTNLLKAQSEYYQTRFQLVFQQKIIDFYKGIPIKL